MAEIAGSSPASGTYSFYMADNLGSPREVYDGSKALAAVFDYTPYGQAYTAHDTVGITHRYTGHDWDATANFYFAPYRFYNPQLARWMSRDPLGMVDGPNVYAYVRARSINTTDPLGLLSGEKCFDLCMATAALCFLFPPLAIACVAARVAFCAMACMEPPPDGGGPPAPCDSMECSGLKRKFTECVIRTQDYDPAGACATEYNAAIAAGCHI